MKLKLLICMYFIMTILAIVWFEPFALGALTYSKWTQNPIETTEKYKDVWESREIVERPLEEKHYKDGDIIGKITIPKMEYYERPIYYGANEVNNNWQITTLGHLGNWEMFGENGRSAVGAHNYQLFTNLTELEVGDLFLIETEDDIFIYEVIGNRIYDHLVDSWYKVSYEDAPNYSVSLMTCWPIKYNVNYSKDTYIVYTKMIKGTKYIS